ncbi:MAG: hypothetical protein KDE56_03165 [Anaerolineales bacterium]|nr:hypothetical protein [Anaerolineales bacterium]
MSTIYSVQHTIGSWVSLAQLRRYRLPVLLAALFMIGLVGVRTVRSSTIPTISVVSVNADESVTIRTHDFPAGHTFVVTMGYMGTAGIGGTVVTTTASGNGGSFDVTYSIPPELRGQQQIAIRLQTEHLYPYYAFNWFYNNTTGVPAGSGQGGQLPAAPGYTGIPTFKITAVERDTSVTIETNNFPANQTFTLTMGTYGTMGIGGTAVDTFDSGAGGTFSKTFAIPTAYHGYERIAIRAQTAHANPYYAYNWFFNQPIPEVATPTPTPVATPVEPPPFNGALSFKVCGVVQNGTVTISTNALPPNQTITVLMGPMYTQGVGGIQAGTFDSGAGNEQQQTFTIPAELHGAYRIAIRIQTSHANPYFAYNWFYNTTATVC